MAEDKKSGPDKGDRPKTPSRKPGHDVGAALRSAYQTALDEDVPKDMLDLLRRLD